MAFGGRGSAKSWQFARALLVHGLSQPLRILCAREYQASIRDSVHRVLADQIERLDLGAFYTVQESAILGANGTEFLFKGLRRDIAQIKSTEGIDICWVEEAEAVSDSIPATIGNKRPARLADGEFVVPARIVSELGNGSTEAGARKLYAMMDRVQRARRGTVGKGRVAKNSRADKHLPA